MEGLQFATNLWTLRLSNNRISDLTPLSGLAELRSLDLDHNIVEDLRPLSGLEAIRTLRLSGNDIAELSAISDLTALIDLGLSNNKVNDLTPLSGLVDLTQLSLDQNDIADLTPLSDLQALKKLGLRINRITNLSPLSRLTGLTHLGIGDNDVVDLSPLKGLNSLRWLNVSRNRIADFAPLWSLSELRSLFAAGNNISDLSWLSGLPALEKLSVRDNAIVDLSPLSGLSELAYLSVHGNRIDDITPIAQLTELTSLGLGWNFIDDLTPLSELTELTDLDVGRNYVTDLTPLSALTSLKTLQLYNNRELSDLGPLSKLTELTDLDLFGNLRSYDLDPISDLDTLTRLRLGYNRIIDVTPLAELTALTTIDLQNNQLSDLSPLVNLSSLVRLDLQNNEIAELSPLVENSGLDAGDIVDVRLNPLSVTSIDSHVPALYDRGVEVTFDSFVVRADDGPRIHNDNVFVLPVTGNIATDERLPWREFATRFYSHFDDVFDFLMFISNARYGEERRRTYFGRYISVANDTQGIGVSDYAYPNEYASTGRLQGVIEFPLVESSIAGGPGLHEVMHRWANFILPPVPHWGHTSAYGQLGGFEADRLVDWGNGRYTAGEFGTVANGGNGVPYSPIELYLAGFISPDEVADLLIAEDAEWLFDDNGQVVVAEDGLPIFTATRIRKRSISDLVAEHGIRTPDHSQAQRKFRAAAILLIDASHPAYGSQLDELSSEVAWFGHVGDLGNHDLYNFYQATGGRAIMAMGGLSQFNSGAAVASTHRRIPFAAPWTPLDERARNKLQFGPLRQELAGRSPDGLDRFSGRTPLHGEWCKREAHTEGQGGLETKRW